MCQVGFSEVLRCLLLELRPRGPSDFGGILNIFKYIWDSLLKTWGKKPRFKKSSAFPIILAFFRKNNSCESIYPIICCPKTTTLDWLKILPKNHWIFLSNISSPRDCLCGKSELANTTPPSLPFLDFPEVLQSLTSSHLGDKKFRTHMRSQVLW